MRLFRERDHFPDTWFAWRPVRALANDGSPAGIVWLETVTCHYIEPTWGAGGKTLYRRFPFREASVDEVFYDAAERRYHLAAPCECGGRCHRDEPDDQFGGPRPCLSKVG